MLTPTPTPTRAGPRSRPARVALIVAVVLLGLGSRRYARHLPRLVAAYAGDTLWALAAFLAVGLLRPRATTGVVAAVALSLSVLVELGQLLKPPWLEAIRRTTLGGLLLGFDFVPSDLACYTLGVALGALGERLWSKRHPRATPAET
jgi:hypothetical protein